MTTKQPFQRPIEPHAIYTRKEVADDFYKSCTRTVDRDIKAGNLEAIQLGGLVRVTGRALMRRFGLAA